MTQAGSSLSLLSAEFLSPHLFLGVSPRPTLSVEGHAVCS